MTAGRKAKESVVMSVPAPLGGWNARDALGEMEETDAVILQNMFPLTTQVIARFGYTCTV